MGATWGRGGQPGKYEQVFLDNLVCQHNFLVGGVDVCRGEKVCAKFQDLRKGRYYWKNGEELED